MHPIESRDAARAAIAEALFTQPRIVLIRSRDIQEFIGTVFPGLRYGAALYAKEYARHGRYLGDADAGYRFEMYHELLHPQFPILAVFNAARGPAEIVSAVLGDVLLNHYRQNYPGLTERAEQAREVISNLAFKEADLPRDRAELEPGVGMVIPQVAGMPPVIHRITPRHLHGPSSGLNLIEFVVPQSPQSIVDTVTRRGFAPWRPDSASRVGTV